MGHFAVCPLLPLVCLAAFGCSSDQVADDESNTVELFSWWTSASERAALDALLEVHAKEHPEVQVINATESLAEKARDRLVDRLSTGLPPDTFQANIGRGPALAATGSQRAQLRR
jgi:glucose/mannose transport system substrate-binding protein